MENIQNNNKYNQSIILPIKSRSNFQNNFCFINSFGNPSTNKYRAKNSSQYIKSQFMMNEKKMTLLKILFRLGNFLRILI